MNLQSKITNYGKYYYLDVSLFNINNDRYKLTVGFFTKTVMTFIRIK